MFDRVSGIAPAANRGLAGRRHLKYRAVLLLAAAIGLIGGLCATSYTYVLEFFMETVWGHIVPGLALWMPRPVAVCVATTVGGAVVGLVLHYFGKPGEISAVVNNLNLRHGRLDIRQTPSMIGASLASITAGGSAGPEAPMVQIVGSIGSWIGRRLRLHSEWVRTLTFCGIAAGLGALFGAPLGGAIFALEIPHRRGLEYYEALVPAIIAAVTSVMVVRFFQGTELPMYHMLDVPKTGFMSMLQGAGMGLVGAAVATIFIRQFDWVRGIAHRFEHHTIALATTGGLLLGVIAAAWPAHLPVTPIFVGEDQIGVLLEAQTEMLAHYGVAVVVLLLVGLVILKMLAVSVTLGSGFRGGFIFPLFMIGAGAGLVIHYLVGPSLDARVAVVGCMAAVCVAVTKTPVSTSIILVTLTDAAMLPIIVTASVVSFVVTSRVSLIRTQRSRDTAAPIDEAEEFRPSAASPAAASVVARPVVD